MKKTNIFAAATAMVMALASLPVVSASAGETFQPGDVDMDGVITGHDSAVVSRALYEEDASLTAEQIALADVNGDGVVDQTDLEWIHGQEKYVIGDTFMLHNKYANGFDAYNILLLDSLEHAGIQIEFSDSAEMATDVLAGYKLYNELLESDTKTTTINPVQYHLMDVDGDGDVDIVDAYNTLYSESWRSAGNPPITETRYEILPLRYYAEWYLDNYGKDLYSMMSGRTYYE